MNAQGRAPGARTPGGQGISGSRRTHRDTAVEVAVFRPRQRRIWFRRCGYVGDQVRAGGDVLHAPRRTQAVLVAFLVTCGSRS